MIKAMKHQTVSLKFLSRRKAVFDGSDAGTGKTFVEIHDFAWRNKKDGKAALVLCPKSLMQAAWANDIKKFAPHLRVSIAWANNRAEALAAPADVYITNHDAAKDLLKYKKAFWSKFSTLIIDEVGAFKHHTSQRSRAVAKITKYFEWRRALSGTITSNGICNIWHPIYLLDNGARLGKSFFGFRSACCVPEQTGPSANHLQWTDKPDIEPVVATLISDITIRHKLEECVDLPSNHMYSVPFNLAPRHLKTYKQLEKESLLILEREKITAINGAVLATKLLQCSSGAMYNDGGTYSKVASERYDLVMDLVEARAHTLVFYQWKHQLEELLAIAKARKISHVVWNPDHPDIEQHFQAGFYQVLFAHPASAAHGLTFTKAATTIWASPTYNLEHFAQGNRRTFRIGQKQKTETIVVIAEGTIDERVWTSCQTKGIRMEKLLEELKSA